MEDPGDKKNNFGKVLFQPLNIRRICDGKERRKCLPEMQDKKVHLSITGTW
jgi:hypothetical protein